MSRYYCQGCDKHSFSTEAGAWDHIRSGRRERGAEFRARIVYPCPDGNGWHTSSSGPKRRYRRGE